MPRPFASIWRSVPADIAPRLEGCIARACERTDKNIPLPVFFRADDIAVPGNQFARLLEIFSRHRIPLSLAVVPAWLTESRWRQITTMGRRTPELWCWHQHGWRHANHEETNKKQEFGPGRPPAETAKDLERGRRRLDLLMGNDFYPVFTPPWNRCSRDTLNRLQELDYRAVSRSKGSLPPPPPGFPDFQVNVDLHTRREPGPGDGWRGLLADLDSAIAGGSCGVMIHHRRMNAAAFDFLEILLKTIAAQKGVFPTDFRGLVNSFSKQYK